jgi:hypothetical protein
MINKLSSSRVKGKRKVNPVTGHEVPEVDYRYNTILSLTSVLDGVGGQRRALPAIYPGKTRYQLHMRLGGPHGRSGRVRKISPLHWDSISGPSTP